MRKNFNNPHGVFVSITGQHDNQYAYADFFNQDGSGTPPDTTCCDGTDFWNSKFAANLASSIGGISGTLINAKTQKDIASINKGPAVKPPANAGNTPPATVGPTTNKKVIYWTIGITTTIAIGVVIVLVSRNNKAGK